MIKSMKKKPAFLSICTLACVSVCIFSACGTSGKDETDIELVHDEEEVTFASTTVEYGDVVQSAKISCTYTPTEHQDLAFMIDDKLIERVNVKKGDIVTAGDVLAAADVGDLKDTIEELKYQINHQNLQLKHVKELKDFDVTRANNLYSYTHMTGEDKLKLQEELKDLDEQYHDSIQDLEDSIALNQKRLAKYQEEYDGGQIIAGISGQITYIMSPLVDTYSEKETKVITISNVDSSYFVVDDVTYADFFEDGGIYNVVYKQNNAETYVEVTPVKREEWQTQMFFKPANNEIFESGLSGTIFMELDRKSNVLCVPNDAIHEAEDGKFVYVLENELPAMRYVEIGLEGLTSTEIVSGLEQGETIVLK